MLALTTNPQKAEGVSTIYSTRSHMTSELRVHRIYHFKMADQHITSTFNLSNNFDPIANEEDFADLYDGVSKREVLPRFA
jgi:hypothetical protein